MKLMNDITSPSGQSYSLDPSGTGFTFAETDELGLYQVAFSPTGAHAEDVFAVNLFQESESFIRPAPGVMIGASEIRGLTESETGQREIWPWLALLALVVMVLEWWIDHRRPIIPAIRTWLQARGRWPLAGQRRAD